MPWVKYLAWLWIGLLAAGGSAWAQQQQPTTTTFQDWVSVCQTVAGTQRCHIMQNVLLENEGTTSRLLQSTVGKLGENLVMQLLLPLGVDLRAGIAIKIDEHEELRSGYHTCLQDGCIAMIGVDEALLGKLRNGMVAKVGFRPFNTEQTLVLEMSLKGFTRASQTIQ